GCRARPAGSSLRAFGTHALAGMKAGAAVGGERGGAVVEQGSGVDQLVGIALLGQEALAALGELGVVGVPADHRVEAGAAAVGLGTEDAAEALGLLLAAAE